MNIVRTRKVAQVFACAWLMSFLFAVVWVPSARADTTIYAYTGNPMVSTEGGCTAPCSISGTITLADPLPPNFSLNTIFPETFTLTIDGNPAITWTEQAKIPRTPGDPEAVLGDIQLATDQYGNIIQWDIQIFTCGTQDCNIPNVMESFNIPQDGFGFVGDGFGLCTDTPNSCDVYNLNDPGTWTVSSSTPEPATVLLLATGLIGILGKRRGKVAPGLQS